MKFNGWLCDDLYAPSPDGMHLFELEKGTKILDSEGKVVRLIEITEATVSSTPAYTALVGNALDFGPSGITFSNSATITMGYHISDVPKDTLALSMRCLNIEDGSWEVVDSESSQTAATGTLEFTTDHFTIFAILAELPGFEVSNLSITPSRNEIWDFPTFAVRTGGEAEITFDVTNAGNHEASHTVSLEINGETVATKGITLAPGQSEHVVFTISGYEPGQYTVVVGGQSMEYTSSLEIKWWLIGGILGALGLIALLLVGWRYRRGRRIEEPAV